MKNRNEQRQSKGWGKIKDQRIPEQKPQEQKDLTGLTKKLVDETIQKLGDIPKEPRKVRYFTNKKEGKDLKQFIEIVENKKIIPLFKALAVLRTSYENGLISEVQKRDVKLYYISCFTESFALDEETVNLILDNSVEIIKVIKNLKYKKIL